MAWKKNERPNTPGPVAPRALRFTPKEVRQPGGRLAIGEIYYECLAGLDGLAAYLVGEAVEVVRVCRVSGVELGKKTLPPAAAASSWVTAVTEDGAPPSPTKWASEDGWIFRLVGADGSSAYLELPGGAS